MGRDNTYCQFKQFRIDQSLAAMKVCTGACVFGAMVEAAAPLRILDIGTGTGLLSLMAAQKFSCPIDAVEMEEGAYRQAFANFQISHWSERLAVFRTSSPEVSPSLQYALIS